MVSNKIISSFVVVLLFIAHIDDVIGHGGMLEPPMRSLAWKYGFDAPVNYDWMSLYCGGLNIFQQNNGKCGLCGDPYNGPFENDKGGVYDTGVIVRHYPVGLREIEVKVEITAHHKGFFQFKLCPNNAQELTQECLDRFPLMIREGRVQGDPFRYFPPKDPKLNELHVLLPQDVTCDRCVLQWIYTSGNSIGKAASGEMCLGCGLQETFVNCADISIGGTLDIIQVTHTNIAPTDGSVVVINPRPDLADIINQASSGSFSDVLTALTDNSNANLIGNNDGFTGSIHSQTNAESKDGFIGSRQSNMNVGQPSRVDQGQPINGFENRDRRMFIPTLNEFNPDPATGPTEFSNVFDSPGQTRNDINGMNIPKPSAIPNGEMARDMNWNQGTHVYTLGQGQPVPTHIPPPSQVSLLNNNGAQHSVNNNQGVVTDKGLHNTLLGSVGDVVGQIRKDDLGALSSDQAVHQQLNNVPSRQFVHQMTELRQTFPNNREWRRGDGVSSSRHAVRHAPHLDTHNFSTREIQDQLPSLPSDIGPRQDGSPLMDPRIHPDMIRFRDNWFPRSQFMMQRQRTRMHNQQMSRGSSQLPRRIVVHSMAIAQHLLRKYPQLKGRVFLSRQAHLRNQYAHMMHKYARRQNWGSVR